MASKSQDPYPTTDDRRTDSRKTRTCTFPGHAGRNPIPATVENFPIRKSGPKAGTFIGWCRACQGLQAKRHKAEPHRHGTRTAVAEPRSYAGMRG